MGKFNFSGKGETEPSGLEMLGAVFSVIIVIGLIGALLG